MMNLSVLIVFNNLLSNTILSSTCRLLTCISQRYFHTELLSAIEDLEYMRALPDNL